LGFGQRCLKVLQRGLQLADILALLGQLVNTRLGAFDGLAGALQILGLGLSGIQQSLVGPFQARVGAFSAGFLYGRGRFAGS
jgi:hypothetical protein